MRYLRSIVALFVVAGCSHAQSQTASEPTAPAPASEGSASTDGSVKWRGNGGWGMGCSYCQGFDLKNATSLTGTVEKVEAITPARGMHQGVHLSLKTDKETVSVHLGPAWYIENQDVTIAPKDKIKVSGVRTQWDGAPAIIAFEVEKDGKTLILRNDQGRPAWAGWRGGPMRGRMR